MSFLAAVPIVFGKPLHIWLGPVLLVLLISQITTGVLLSRGKRAWLRSHKLNVLFLIIPVGLVHVHYGIGIWFLGFK